MTDLTSCKCGSIGQTTLWISLLLSRKLKIWFTHRSSVKVNHSKVLNISPHSISGNSTTVSQGSATVLGNFGKSWRVAGTLEIGIGYPRIYFRVLKFGIQLNLGQWEFLMLKFLWHCWPVNWDGKEMRERRHEEVVLESTIISCFSCNQSWNVARKGWPEIQGVILLSKDKYVLGPKFSFKIHLTYLNLNIYFIWKF